MSPVIFDGVQLVVTSDKDRRLPLDSNLNLAGSWVSIRCLFHPSDLVESIFVGFESFQFVFDNQLSVGAGSENRTRDIQLGKLTFYL